MGLSRMKVPTSSSSNQEQPLVDDQQQQDIDPSQIGGEATLEPSQDLNNWIRYNIHYIVIFAIVAFLVLRRVRVWYLDYSSRAQVSHSTPDSKINEGIAQARARQMMAVKEAQKRDAELREQRRLEDLAEKERKMKELREQTTGTGANGNNNDGSAGGASTSFSERLPTLPSGRSYTPSDSWGGGSGGSGGGGGHYRPTGFSRPSARRG